MHKARENNDGSFSIGKTWVLDDLSAIMSFSGWVPQSPTEQQQKLWASDVGFAVTIQKIYYWQAGSAKEKEFFIGSLLKIYKKYTGGKSPNLIGFDEREWRLLVGPGSPPPATKAPDHNVHAPDTQVPSSRPPVAHKPHNQPPLASRVPGQEEPREIRRRPLEDPSLRAQRSRDQVHPPSTSDSAKAVPPPFRPQQTPPSTSFDQERPSLFSSNERVAVPELLAAESRAPKPPSVPVEPRNPNPLQKQRLYGDLDNGSQASFPSFSDARSISESRSYSRGQDMPPSSPVSKRTRDVFPPSTPISSNVENMTAPQSPASGFGQSWRKESFDKLSVSESYEKLHDNSTLNGSLTASSPGPPLTLRPGSSRSNMHTTPSPISEKLETAKPPTPQEAKPDEPNVDVPPVSSPTSAPMSPLDAGEEEEEEKEEHRPGLGPMVKKKPGKDVAGAFRKAATAYGAFKPRPGGAGERLLASATKEKNNSDEPDGITGVVPAPSLRPNNDSKGQVPETPIQEKPFSFPSPIKEIPSFKETPPQEVPTPTVEITQAPNEDLAAALPTTPSVEGIEEPRASLGDTSDSKSAKERSVSPSPNGRRRRRREDNIERYCHSLGIDPSVLEGQGVEFDDTLTDLGWYGRLGDDKRIEDLEADIRREIGRVEATSWLGNLEQQEGKIDNLARLVDKTIEECEELDGLLTLYSHELNVSHGYVRVYVLTFNLLTRLYRLSTMTWAISKPSPKVYKCKLLIRSFLTTSCKTC